MKTKDKNIIMILVFVVFYLWQVLKKSSGDEELSDADLTKAPDPVKEPYLFTKFKKGDSGPGVKRIQERLKFIMKDIQYSAQLYNTGVMTEIQTNEFEAWGNKMFFNIDDMLNNGGIDGKFGEYTRRCIVAVLGKSTCTLAELRLKAIRIKEMCTLPVISKMQIINNDVSDNSDFTIVE